MKRPKFLAATSNLRVEQNLVHLGRFLHFSQRVVGVTLKKNVWSGYSHTLLDYIIRQCDSEFFSAMISS